MNRNATLALPFFAAAGWFALGIDSIVRSEPEGYRDVAMLAPWALSAATYALVHQRQRGRGGRAERWGFALVVAGMLAGAIGMVGVAVDNDALRVTGLPVGMLSWTVGMLVFGWGTVKAGVFRTGIGYAIMASEPAAIALGVVLSPIAGLHESGSYSGGIANGVVVLMIGLALVAMGRRERVAGNAGRPSALGVEPDGVAPAPG